MTITFLIITAILLILLNSFVLKRKSPIARVLISAGVVIGLFLLYLLLIVVLWNSSKNPREEERQELGFNHLVNSFDQHA